MVPRCRPTSRCARSRCFGDDIQILNGYGLTETTSAVVTNVGVEFAAHPDSVGRPNLTADVRVVDADGTPLGVGEVGEICFRSPQVVKGYWNDDGATAASFDDGWFHSGDIGYVDADGFVHVVDRMKDVVIRGGENVYCTEVEAVLHEHPAVAEVAVVGLDERDDGRAGVRGGRASTRRRGRPRRSAGASPPHGSPGSSAPRRCTLTDELPKTATGKVAKNVLRGQVADADTAVERMW